MVFEYCGSILTFWMSNKFKTSPALRPWNHARPGGRNEGCVKNHFLSDERSEEFK